MRSRREYPDVFAMDPAAQARRRAIVYLLVAFVWGLILWRVEANHDNEERRARTEAVIRCRDRQDDREVLRQVAMAATSGGGTDFEKLPSFSKLDLATQQIFREVRAANIERLMKGQASLREEFLRNAPPIVCPGDPGYQPPKT